MFLSKLELEDDSGLLSRLKLWLGDLNKSVKNGTTPTFNISGPVELVCRERTVRGFAKFSYPFVGGEPFYLSSIATNTVPEKDGNEIVAIFTPAGLDMLQKVFSLTLPLADAIDVFDGFSAWIDLSSIQSETALAEKVKLEEQMIKLPSVEETRADSSWGAW